MYLNFSKIFLFLFVWGFCFLKILFIVDRGEGREKKRETSMCGCLLCAPYWGPGLQPRPVL